MDQRPRHKASHTEPYRKESGMDFFFLPNKQSKILYTSVETISDMILKGKLRVCQLTGMDRAAIVVPFTNVETSSL